MYFAKKRGSGLVRGESAFGQHENHENEQWGIADVIGKEPTPEFAVSVVENCECLINLLPENLRVVARLKLEGYTNEEIALKIGCVLRTVERRLERIREIWMTITAD